jgi:sulfatase maturation enzyme AslB (radical SAM superfamily)
LGLLYDIFIKKFFGVFKMVFHVMIIPTLGCPSNCGYCWSSEEDSELMTVETI